MKYITDIVAIDGPAGAGKSSAARRAADRLGFAFLDTGAMYRAATWWAMDQGADLEDPEALAECTQRLPLEMHETREGVQVLAGGRDVSDAIRTPEVTRLIYKLDQNPRVREHLVALQREYGAKGPAVAEGRDMGTVVFPNAKCKIYLDASIEQRARRRAAQLEAKGVQVDMESLVEEIRDRDEKSKTRAVAPLRKAEDAVLLDTTHLTLQQTVDAIVDLARTRMGTA